MDIERKIEKSASFIAHHWPVKKTIERMDAVTRHGGLSAGANFILSERRMTVIPQWDDEEKTQNILVNQNKPAIIVFNHPDGIEPFATLAAFPPKENLSIIRGGLEEIFGPEVRNHMINVYLAKKGETSEEKSIRRNKNEDAIVESIQKLESDESIMIAPDGGKGDGKWRNGSVSLVQGALELDEAYLIMAHVPRTSTRDIIKSLIFKKPSSMTVRISEPINVQELPVANSAISDHSRLLEEYYNTWASS